MIGSTRNVRVFGYAAPCDMRKQYDSLAVIVKLVMRKKLEAGDLFLFVARNRKRAKVLYFDGTGLCLFAKRLEKGRFAELWSEPSTPGIRELTMNELSLFLEGSEHVGRIMLSPPVVKTSDRRVVFA